jgi:hypothetical protein
VYFSDNRCLDNRYVNISGYGMHFLSVMGGRCVWLSAEPPTLNEPWQPR